VARRQPAQRGYVVRGGRMLESKYLCTYDLFNSIPTLDKTRTVTEEIFEWNRVISTSSRSRLIRSAHRIDAPEFGLRERHILALEAMMLEPEAILGDSSIRDHFDEAFFQTNFWLMWCTTFAFQPWHSAVEFKRYLLRFTHMVKGFNQLHGIMRTVYNQYESMILPLRKWLEEHGVAFERDTEITDLEFTDFGTEKVVSAIRCCKHGREGRIGIRPEDRVIATLGSMTEASDIGSMDRPPALHHCQKRGAWALWKNIAKGRQELGHPDVFADHIDESKWISFTITTKTPTLFQIVRDLTGNVPGEGGLITFADSRWLLSVVLPHQPHFISQPEGVQVLWGYALNVNDKGDFVDKPMAECNGRDILIELLGHLGVTAGKDEIIEASICLPCMMPYITSQFLRRRKGDRPAIRPAGYRNLAVVGQFCEQPDDVVFTVEYSVRAAMSAVYSLLGLNKAPPAVYKGQFNPSHIYAAERALHDKIA
jgi:oleate hydratase